MSAEVQESGNKKKGSKQKKMTVRVDFTPMVDMNMLLITFFMLCTSLSKPQTDLKISEDDFRKQLSEIKSGKNTPTVIIKATDEASYRNLIDALDEMQICNIGKYVITDIAEADQFLIKNYDSKGELSQNLAE